jgi:membrane-associated protease RseP (regulator of RpoE activity)
MPGKSGRMRYETMMRMRGIWILLLALVLPGMAQGQQVWSLQTNRGWIGISFNYSSAVLPGGSEETVVIIEEVVDGSPAEAAGIQAGDTLTHLDGQPISEEVMTTLTRTLEVGDLVRLTILRGDRPREVLVEAGPQGPRNWVLAPNDQEVVIRLDSVRGAIMENLDSLRLTISGLEVMGSDSVGSVAIRLVEPGGREGRGSEEDAFGFTYRFGRTFLVDSLHRGDDTHTDPNWIEREFYFPSSDPAVPFGALVISTKETEPLREELRSLRKELTDLRRQELSRIRELQAGFQGPIEELIEEDARIRELKAQEEELLQKQRQATMELQRLTEETMQRQFAEIQIRHEEAVADAVRRNEGSTERSRGAREEALRQREQALLEQYELQAPSRHIIVGQNFVAGAQLTPLNPALAEYFGVDRGVLVTEVLDGTPAHEAGVLAGDVIVRVGTQQVSSLKDLRFGIGYFERPLRLRVIRKGSPLEIVIGS